MYSYRKPLLSSITEGQDFSFFFFFQNKEFLKQIFYFGLCFFFFTRKKEKGLGIKIHFLIDTRKNIFKRLLFFSCWLYCFPQMLTVFSLALLVLHHFFCSVLVARRINLFKLSVCSTVTVSHHPFLLFHLFLFHISDPSTGWY